MIFFEHALQLAERGRGKTSPNPFVGAVIVKDGAIVGEGYTQPWGQDHAEVQAIKDAQAKCAGAEMYVTLEPCNHFGKTPPCTEAIIKAGIKTVYAGIIDPNPKVNGKGFAKLEEAGVRVVRGLYEKHIEKQLEAYLTNMRKQRPFFTLKTAISLDGKIALDTGESRWITSEPARVKVHELRLEYDAVLTGINTVLADDPLLNVRFCKAHRQPLRLVLDSCLKIPLTAKLVQSASEQPLWIFRRDDFHAPQKEKLLTQKGVKIFPLPQTETGLSLASLAEVLFRKGVCSVIIEAGQSLNDSFMRSGLCDKLHIFVAPKLLGGSKNAFLNLAIDKMANSINVSLHTLEKIGEDIHIVAYPQN